MSTSPLAVVPLRLGLRSGGLQFPEFSGSLWHGGLGMVLERHFRPAFELLYGGDAETRLYALRPPTQEHIAAEIPFELHLTLFGPACRHILACTQAVAQLGEAGIRPAGRFRLETAAVIGPDGDRPFFAADTGLLAPPAAFDLHDYLKAAPHAGRLRVRLLTPLRIKEGNEILRRPPRYEQLIHRLCGRIDQLAHAAGSTPPLAKADRPALLAEAGAVRLTRGDTRWTDLSRRSGRSGRQMAFGGLVGELEYEGIFDRTLPWLLAGRCLHIGGKPAFGFGGYGLELA